MGFAERLKKARKKVGFTQQDIANILKTTPQNYAQYETGKRKPRKETLLKIADALNLGYNYAQNGEPYFYDFVDTINRPEYAENEAFNKWQYKDAMACNPEDEVFISIKNVNSQLLQEQKDKEIQFLEAMKKLGGQLNSSGKDKALEQVELLTKIPEYRKDGSPD